jgi:hypothetical protein
MPHSKVPCEFLIHSRESSHNFLCRKKVKMKFVRVVLEGAEGNANAPPMVKTSLVEEMFQKDAQKKIGTTGTLLTCGCAFPLDHNRG